jgi:hypothetical protein
MTVQGSSKYIIQSDWMEYWIMLIVDTDVSSEAQVVTTETTSSAKSAGADPGGRAV